MNNSTTPFWSNPLVYIPILGLIVASLALLVRYLGLKSQTNPELSVETTRCDHKIRYRTPNVISRDNIVGTELVISVQIKNTGVRTTIYDVEIICHPILPLYRTKEMVIKPEGIIIDRGGVANYTHQFFVQKQGLFNNPLNCRLILHHTYGEEKVMIKSNLRG